MNLLFLLPDRHLKYSDTEIITVPDKIVTVQARDGDLSQASASSLNSENQVVGLVSSASEEKQPAEVPVHSITAGKSMMSKVWLID